MILSVLALALGTSFPRYTITDLGIDQEVGSGGMGVVASIDDAGLIAGTQTTHGREHAFTWSGGRVLRLPELSPDSRSGACEVNERGEVCGWVGEGRNALPAVWNAGRLKVAKDFQPCDGRWISINDKSETVGFAFDMTDPDPDGNHPYFSFFQDSKGLVRKLPKGVGAQVVDNNGTIFGTAEGPIASHDVVRLEGDTWEFLKPSLNGVVAINHKGSVLGTQPIDSELDESVIWDRGNVIDCPQGHFLALNDECVAVGETGSFWEGNGHAVIARETVTVDLNTLVDNLGAWKLVNASGINNKDEIVGAGLLNGKGRFFLLKPK